MLVLELVVDQKVTMSEAPGCRDIADCMGGFGLDGLGCGALSRGMFAWI